ncbi:hypothetical protein M409DRAFT_25571 [Zasmidium cellare ATCC 36951]|uniref:Uncharacterized protein n=1 Tax=Zasmidium cellare ATCC 36951 TaxID=1080233 RepID=A0A6A6CEY6_ZASCE|nr:uncharacterized protein M409DRAFT_25571 [Zasmidium cellare ATCC 36951]KAF2164229.1 hypothetical protein M409DRAFT_25571 [Zasmidium cellare ATCC 36951]
MFFNKAIGALALALALIGSTKAAPTLIERVTPCTANYRIAELNGVAPAFSDQTPGATAKFLQQLPLKPDAHLILYIDGAPGITVAPDASTVRDFALGVRQLFYKVYPTSSPASTDYGNGTTHTELEIITGVLHTIALPLNIHAGMNFNYDLADCQIKTIQGFLTIPSAVGGVPVNRQAVANELLAAGNAGL